MIRNTRKTLLKPAVHAIMKMPSDATATLRPGDAVQEHIQSSFVLNTTQQLHTLECF
jgi:hypothetical protein